MGHVDTYLFIGLCVAASINNNQPVIDPLAYLCALHTLIL